MKKIIRVTSPARIHLGFLETDENSFRKFGSLGLAISNFENIFKIESSTKNIVVSEDSKLKKDIMRITKSFEKFKKIKKCKITVLKKIPAHIGLGSGTQQNLTVGHLLSEFNNLNLSVRKISEWLNRGKRSGIGVETFKNGGFIIDSGKKSKSLPLTIFSTKWPEEWKIILITTSKKKGLFGEDENKVFKNLKKNRQSYAEENCYATLMKIIPGILEKDFFSFSAGIQIVQNNMSNFFYGSKDKYGNNNLTQIFRFLKRHSYQGFGQSSWGPTGFIFCESKKNGELLLKDIKKFIELKKIQGINLLLVDGRNKGKTKTTRIEK